jgi:hypothetical protein
VGEATADLLTVKRSIKFLARKYQPMAVNGLVTIDEVQRILGRWAFAL